MDIAVMVDIPDDLARIKGDRTRLMQVLLNAMTLTSEGPGKGTLTTIEFKI